MLVLRSGMCNVVWLTKKNTETQEESPDHDFTIICVVFALPPATYLLTCSGRN